MFFFFFWVKRDSSYWNQQVVGLGGLKTKPNLTGVTSSSFGRFLNRHLAPKISSSECWYQNEMKCVSPKKLSFVKLLELLYIGWSFLNILYIKKLRGNELKCTVLIIWLIQKFYLTLFCGCRIKPIPVVTWGPNSLPPHPSPSRNF